CRTARRRRGRPCPATTRSSPPVRDRDASSRPRPTACPRSRWSTGRLGSPSDLRELDLQSGQAPQDPRRLVGEPACARRPVVLLGETDVAHAVEDAFKADATLGPRQWSARTGVDTTTEGDVVEGVLPVDAEIVRALEPPGIAVGGAVEEHHRRPRLDLDTADRGRPLGEAEVGLDRTLDPQGFLDEVGDAVLVFPKLVLDLRVLAQVLEGGGEQAGRGLLSGSEEERRRTDHGGHRRRGAVRVRGHRQLREDVVSRLAAPFLDIAGEPFVESGERVLTLVVLVAGANSARLPAQAEELPERLVVGLGYAEKVGDDQHGERLRVGA